MRPGILLAHAALLCAWGAASALQHSVTQFSADSSASAADRYRLDPGWGDSLLLLPEAFRYTSMKAIKLSDTRYENGDAGASPVAASTGMYKFNVFYLSWKGSPHDNSIGAYPPPPSREAPRANIVSRTIDLSPDTADIDIQARVMALQEVVTEIPPKFFYSNGAPGPTYFNYAADGDRFAAYWGTGTPNGPVRRLTHLDGPTGTYVIPATPVVTGGFGKLSSALVPGSGGTRTVLAYETDFATRRFQVRWEQTAPPASSVASAAIARPVFPEDFAVAADSLGNTVVMWRENADLYAMAFDPARAELQPPTLIQAGVIYNDTIDHLYRPYAVASLKRNAFIIAYSLENAGACNIITRSLLLPGAGGWTVGPPVALTSNHYNLFPDIAVSADRAVIGYFQRIVGPTAVRRFMGSVLEKSGNTLSFNVGRTDLDFANENITFTGVHNNWNRYHALKAASVSIDSKGNVVAAYDSGAHAKVALVRNTPIYYDSSFFASRGLKVENPAIPTFVFNPASDSVDFLALRSQTTDSAQTILSLAVSPTVAFAGPAAAFRPFSPAKSATGFYKYRVDMLTRKTGNPTTTNLSTPKVKSLEVLYNVKPWTPVVDSIRTGASPQAAYNGSATYTLLTRKDSLKIVCHGFDADDNGMEFRISLGNTVLATTPGTQTSPGNYSASLALLPPDTLLNPLVLSLTTVDSGGWSSRAAPLTFVFRNVVPAQTVRIHRNKGRDSSGTYLPYGGGVDTLTPAEGVLLYVQAGDSLAVSARYADDNDPDLTATWQRNSFVLGTKTQPVTDSLLFRFTPDAVAPIIDTLVIKAGDKDTTVTLRIPVRPNRLPAIDSVFHASYKGKDSLWKAGPFDKVKDFAADTGLVIPAGLSTMVQAGISDPDAGDALAIKWRIFRQPAGCAHGDFSCYAQTDSGAGASITRVFGIQEQCLTVRATDPTGAFLERRIWLEYPVLDTAGTAAAIRELTGDIAFTIDAARRDSTVVAQVSSQGTATLIVTSVRTLSNDRKWADFKLTWLAGTPPARDSAVFPGPTNVNALLNESGGRTISLAPGASLDLSFHFFSDSLRGDSVLTDTLLVQTNDFANPVLRIPFSITYRDLPVATLSVPGSPRAGPAGAYNAAGLPRLVPARSSIAVSFSETVRILQPEQSFRVYSLLDSLKSPAGKGIIAGTYAYRRKPASGLGKSSAWATAWAADSLADTLIFTPAYDKPSDSLKVRPNPGYFIHRDILRMQLSNGITDRAGNALDLRLDKTVLVPGSLDSAFQARVDTSYLAVVSTSPTQNESGWDPEAPIRIRFNRKLSRRPPAGADTLTLMDLNAFNSGDNRAIGISSLYRHGRGYDFRILSLADNDSTLVIGTRPFLPALDTVTLTLSGGILDTSGLSLDGNGNRLPEWLYDQQDTVDRFTLTFTTRDADFYVFPNPFRFSDSRHRDKGAITFKNLNTLRGYSLGSDVVMRVHTMNGDLVYKTSTAQAAKGDPDRKIHTSLDWNLRNNHGSTVGTGVYIYTLMVGNSRVLAKGKVAVVR